MALEKFKAIARRLKLETAAIYLAARHPQTPLLAKLLALFVIAYALSPVDLIPDFIPIIGLLDDIILLPLLIALTIRMIPAEVWEECRKEAKGVTLPKNLWGLALILGIWITAVTMLAYLFWPD